MSGQLQSRMVLMSEATLVEKPCVAYALSQGWKHRKLDAGRGGRAWPDGLFWGREGAYYWWNSSYLANGCHRSRAG